MQATINGIKGRWVSTDGMELDGNPWYCSDNPTGEDATVSYKASTAGWKYVFLPSYSEMEMVTHPEPEPDTETLRDRFAIRILNGLLSNPTFLTPRSGETVDDWLDRLCDSSYRGADSMMEARNNSPAKKE